MKLNSVSPIKTTDNTAPKLSRTNFKGVGTGILNGIGSMMQGIENTGYVGSFLIQDGLGMTVPRTITGFHRDKDVTGKYNIKEGLEVFGREGSTGPFMMAVAPAMVALTGKFCKSTNTNTKILKVLGDNLKKMLANNGLTQEIKANKQEFLKYFNKYNIAEFYKTTVKEDKNPEEAIKYLSEEFEKYANGDKKASSEAMNNMVNYINSKITSLSSDFNKINSVQVEYNDKLQTYQTTKFIRAIRDFGVDAIERNPEFASISEETAENIKNNLATRRLLFNIGNVALTLGGLAVLPKLYAFNKVAPGAQIFVQDKQKQAELNDNADNKEKENKDVTFKGKNINADGLFAKIGKFLTKKIPAWVQEEFEYNGFNFTPTLMACLSLFGLLLPRGIHAYNRALVDENGKKDMTEIHEILTRDTISSLGVVYTVPILTKVIVNSYESNRGFVLTNKASMNKGFWKKFIDVINPYSDLKVYSNAELKAIYGGIDSKEKMLNFCNFIKDKKGDLGKILNRADDPNSIFNEKTFTLDSTKEMTLEARNEKFVEFFKNFEQAAEKLVGKSDAEAQNNLIKKLMQNANKAKKSKLSTIACGLNSVPGFIATVIISPVLLGVLIPKLTYASTRKAHAKMAQQSEAGKDNKSSD